MPLTEMQLPIIPPEVPTPETVTLSIPRTPDFSSLTPIDGVTEIPVVLVKQLVPHSELYWMLMLRYGPLLLALAPLDAVVNNSAVCSAFQMFTFSTVEPSMAESFRIPTE